ncbi:MAG: DUF89 family protein [Bacteroidales bacterium]|nr:DUF89 family protein [Bacteroidales bacterium]
MKTYLDCIPCFMAQAIRAGRMADMEETGIKGLLDAMGGMLKDISLESTPPETGLLIYRKVTAITGVSDPFKKAKEAGIAEALSLYPQLIRVVRSSGNPLLTAIRLAVAGNIIDLGVDGEYDIKGEINRIMDQDFAIFDYDGFREYLNRAGSVLYIGDNAGESVFDKILIGELGKKVTYVVRDAPVVNDVTFGDAVASGLEEVAEIISSGCPAPGTIPELCNDDFLERYRKADMIISKGQGNYEGLSDSGRPVFFMLKAKCSVLARDLGVRKNDIVLKMHQIKT